MANIVINGTQYDSVSYFLVPKVTSGNAEFTDTSDTMSWLGKNATQTGFPTYSVSAKLSDTSFKSWTPSTTATTIVSSINITDKLDANLASYEYYLVWECGCNVNYNSGTTNQAKLLLSRAYLVQNICKRPSSLENVEVNNFNGNTSVSLYTANFLKYYGTSTNSATNTWSQSYGIYFVPTQPSFDSSTSNTPKITIKTPQVSARCSTTYFSTANASLVDQANSPWFIRLKIYKVRKNSIYNNIYQNVVRLVNE